MLLNALQARPQAQIGLLITTLSILVFHAICGVFSPGDNTFSPPSPSPSHLSLPLPDQAFLDDVKWGVIQSSISDLSNSLAQINASLAALHAKLDYQAEPPFNEQNEKNCSSPSRQHQVTMTPTETLAVIGVFLLFPFFIGISIFLEDASHISHAHVTRTISLMLGAANVGLGFGVFVRRYAMWHDYMLSIAWLIVAVMFGVLISHGYDRSRKLEVERKEAFKE